VCCGSVRSARRSRAVWRWPRVRCCYEARPIGYGLARQLHARGIGCDVVAFGLMAVRPGDRIKTDPRDARTLARLHAAGLLEAITISSEQVEALRDLVRAREDARIDRMRDRHSWSPRSAPTARAFKAPSSS